MSQPEAAAIFPFTEREREKFLTSKPRVEDLKKRRNRKAKQLAMVAGGRSQEFLE